MSFAILWLRLCSQFNSILYFNEVSPIQQSLITQVKRSKFKVAKKVLRNKLNIAQNLTDYQKSKHFSNALKDSGV